MKINLSQQTLNQLQSYASLELAQATMRLADDIESGNLSPHETHSVVIEIPPRIWSRDVPTDPRDQEIM